MTIRQTLTPSNYLKLSTKSTVSKIEVFDFKENWCDENRIIADLIRKKAGKYLKPPILDVGAGLGDIAYKAFPEREAILIDVNEIMKEDYPLSKNHRREQVDFFNYRPGKAIKTMLISHTLQFLDSDVEKLNKKITEINPEHLILVMNENNDFMGDLIKWSEGHYVNPDPEVHLKQFPIGYHLESKIPFVAKLQCPDFEKLAKQISYLMLIELSETGTRLKDFLKERLEKPEFKFSQSIEIYKRNGK